MLRTNYRMSYIQYIKILERLSKIKYEVAYTNAMKDYFSCKLNFLLL